MVLPWTKMRAELHDEKSTLASSIQVTDLVSNCRLKNGGVWGRTVSRNVLTQCALSQGADYPTNKLENPDVIREVAALHDAAALVPPLLQQTVESMRLKNDE